jgi:integrase
MGYPSYLQPLPENVHSTFTPYIFTTEEVHMLFEAADSTVANGYQRYTHVMPALLRLLYGCGTRISEALNLKCENVLLDQRRVILRKTKNSTERVLPLSESVAEAMSAYAKRWSPLPDGLFFSDENGNAVTSDAIYRSFRILLRRCKISHGGKGHGPRLHDLRHTFAAHSLASMSKSGLDLYYSLPVLSRYLGHRSLEATEHYVRLTEAMYPDIVERMNKICAGVFPEVPKR